MGLDLDKFNVKRSQKSAEKIDRLTLKDGENYLRILPPDVAFMAGSVDYISKDYLMHFKLGVEGNFKSALCPRTFGKDKKCPVCEAVWALYKTKDKSDESKAKDIRAKTRHLFNVLDLNAKEKGIQILEVGIKVYEKILLYVTNPKYGDILDLDEGRNGVLTKTNKAETKTGFEDYDFVADPDKTSIRSFLPPNFKDVIASLETKIPKVKSYEEIKALLYGEEVPESAAKPAVAEVPVVVHTEVPAVKAAGVDETVQDTPAPTGTNPDCFGTDEYGPKREKCVKCPVKRACVTAFLV